MKHLNAQEARVMGRWNIELYNGQRVLMHICEQCRSQDTHSVLRQDIGGGYVRCIRCGEKYLPAEEPGSPHLLLRLKPNALEQEHPLADIVVAL